MFRFIQNIINNLSLLTFLYKKCKLVDDDQISNFTDNKIYFMSALSPISQWGEKDITNEDSGIMLRFLQKIFNNRIVMSYTTNTNGYKPGVIYDCGEPEERYMTLCVLEKNNKTCSLYLNPRKIPHIRQHQARYDAVKAGLGPYETKLEVIREHQLKYHHDKIGEPFNGLPILKFCEDRFKSNTIKINIVDLHPRDEELCRSVKGGKVFEKIINDKKSLYIFDENDKIINGAILVSKGDDEYYSVTLSIGKDAKEYSFILDGYEDLKTLVDYILI